MKIGEIKKNARDFLKENYWSALALCALYLVVSVVISIVSNLVGRVPIIGAAAPLVITICILVPIAYGWIKNFMDLKYGKTKSVTEFIKGGFDNFERAVSTWWSASWREFLKILPGSIIAGIGMIMLIIGIIFIVLVGVYTSDDFSSAFREEIGDNYEEFVETSELIVDNIDYFEKFIGIMLGACWIFIIIGAIVMLPFVLQYIIYDIIAVDRPDLSAAEVAKESVKLMKGNRIKYIGLILSFAGWWILSIITCGIGFIFLMPYMQVSRISFYESIKEENGTELIKSEEENVVQ